MLVGMVKVVKSDTPMGLGGGGGGSHTLVFAKPKRNTDRSVYYAGDDCAAASPSSSSFGQARKDTSPVAGSVKVQSRLMSVCFSATARAANAWSSS